MIYFNVWLQVERADLEADECVTLEPFTERLASFRSFEAARLFVEKICESASDPDNDVSDEYIQEMHDRMEGGPADDGGKPL